MRGVHGAMWYAGDSLPLGCLTAASSGCMRCTPLLVCCHSWSAFHAFLRTGRSLCGWFQPDLLVMPRILGRQKQDTLVACLLTFLCTLLCGVRRCCFLCAVTGLRDLCVQVWNCVGNEAAQVERNVPLMGAFSGKSVPGLQDSAPHCSFIWTFWQRFDTARFCVALLQQLQVPRATVFGMRC